MYKLMLFLTVLNFSKLFGQTQNGSQHELHISGSKIFFGTGDFSGYTLQVEGARRINKHKHLLLKKLLLGVELAFESGVSNPAIMNPTPEEFIGQSFYHISNTIGTLKLSYYPLSGFAKGLHVSVGPCLGFSNFSYEAMATLARPADASRYRSVMLRFNNSWLVGYKIGTGYNIYIGKQLLAGVRLDFENFNNGNINTSYGLKAGLRL